MIYLFVVNFIMEIFMTVLTFVLIMISTFLLIFATMFVIKQIIKKSFLDTLESCIIQMTFFFANLIYVFIGNTIILSASFTIFMAITSIYFIYEYFHIKKKTISNIKKEFPEMINDFLVFYRLKK